MNWWKDQPEFNEVRNAPLEVLSCELQSVIDRLQHYKPQDLGTLRLFMKTRSLLAEVQKEMDK